MSDNDLDIEGLIGSIRSIESSQRTVEAIFEEPDPVPVEENFTLDEIVLTQPMTAPVSIPFHTYYPNSAEFSIHSNGDSLTFSPNGNVRLHTEGLADRILNLSTQDERITTLNNRIAQLENTVNLLGQALQAQIDNDTMSQLAPEERNEIRRVVAERDSNLATRRERMQQLGLLLNKRTP